LFGVGDFSITPMDGSLVALVLAAVQWVKGWKLLKKLPSWVVPLLPFLIGWLLAIPVVYIVDEGAKPIPVMVMQVFYEGIKVAVLSMAAYKVTHEASKARKSSNESPGA